MSFSGKSLLRSQLSARKMLTMFLIPGQHDYNSKKTTLLRWYLAIDIIEKHFRQQLCKVTTPRAFVVWFLFSIDVGNN